MNGIQNEQRFVPFGGSLAVSSNVQAGFRSIFGNDFGRGLYFCCSRVHCAGIHRSGIRPSLIVNAVGDGRIINFRPVRRFVKKHQKKYPAQPHQTRGNEPFLIARRGYQQRLFGRSRSKAPPRPSSGAWQAETDAGIGPGDDRATLHGVTDVSQEDDAQADKQPVKGLCHGAMVCLRRDYPKFGVTGPSH
jgi:hypothetical protein